MSGLPAAAVVLGPACGAMVLVLAAAARPARGRAGSLRPHEPSPPAPALGDRIESFGGRLIRLVQGRHPAGPARPPRPEHARAAAALALTTVCLAPISPLVALAGGGAAAVLPLVRHRRAERARMAAFEADLPEVVDLLGLALGAGLNVALALAAVGRRGSGPLSAELARTAEEAALGRRLSEAIEAVPARCGESTRPLTTLLASGERYGVPLVESLDRLAVDVRASQRRRAEEAARRLPVKMLFPLVLCILPAFALLTFGPLLLTSFGSLSI